MDGIFFTTVIFHRVHPARLPATKLARGHNRRTIQRGKWQQQQAIRAKVPTLQQTRESQHAHGVEHQLRIALAGRAGHRKSEDVTSKCRQRERNCQTQAACD